jgi:hypothetical protein
VPRASRPIFMFCAPRIVFGGIEGVGNSFHVLHSCTRFRRYRGRQYPFSCFARPDSLSAVPRALFPVFMFCARGLVFGRTEGVGSRFNVLRARTLFRQYRGSLVPLSCFALLESFSTVPSASGPVFMFYAPDSLSAVARASGLVFMFCVPGLVFDGIEGVGSRFLVLRSRNVFRRYHGRRVPF